MIDSILSQIAAHWKAGVISSSILAGIGLMANEVTSPKVFAVAIFLSDWSMLWTWDWWSRTILWGAVSLVIWRVQKRKFTKLLLAQKELVAALQSELRHADLMIGVQKTRINILERK